MDYLSSPAGEPPCTRPDSPHLLPSWRKTHQGQSLHHSSQSWFNLVCAMILIRPTARNSVSPLGLVLLSVFVAAGKNNKRMYGSLDASDGQFPYTVFHILRTQRGFNTCSGSLLTPRWVLLAAHCVNRDAGNPRNHLIVAGKANLNPYLNRRFRTNFQVSFYVPYSPRIFFCRRI